MGNTPSSHNWEPPPQPHANMASGPPVDYHMVASEVALIHQTDCGCFPKVHVTMASDTLYAMLAEQFTKGYRMVYFERRPGDLRMSWGGSVFAFFIGFFRMNPNLGERLEEPVTWSLRIEKSWVRSRVEDIGGFLSFSQRRVVHMDQLVDSIARNAQHGERLVAATVTGQSEPCSSYGEFASGISPFVGVDLFFEVPNPPTREHYVYNIALVPVHVEYQCAGLVFFPEIQCDWMGVLQQHLAQGWRLIDIFIDTPMVQQFQVPQKQKRHFCRPTDTDALWIFERPASMGDNPRPLYEGTIVEQEVQVTGVRLGVKSSPDWLPLIRDMGMRGWELSCVLESHKAERTSWAAPFIIIKSLLFFQRPLPHD